MKFKGGTGWAREIWIVEPSPQPGEGSRMDTADNPRRISKNEKTTRVSCSSAYFQRQHRSGALSVGEPSPGGTRRLSRIAGPTGGLGAEDGGTFRLRGVADGPLKPARGSMFCGHGSVLARGILMG
jgi:hypothetical protein